MSTGHGGVFCEGCHGATHAEFDTDAPSLTNDDVTAIQLQGHAGTIVECSTCHGDAMNDSITLEGPHGMHPVGDDTRFADGGHEELARRNLRACQACHGPGGYESRQADRRPSQAARMPPGNLAPLANRRGLRRP